MPAGSSSVTPAVPPRDIVRGCLLAAITMAFLTGMSFVICVQKMAQNDPFYVWLILLLALLILAGGLNVRRILKAVP